MNLEDYSVHSPARSSTTASSRTFKNEDQITPDQNQEGSDKARPKKRSRAIQTCSMCVRRKTKCNQVVPCEACIKRGNPHDCVIELIEPTTQVRVVPSWATKNEVSDLRKRLEILELLVSTKTGVNLDTTSTTTGLHLEQHNANAVASTSAGVKNGNGNGNEMEESAVAAVLQMLREGSAGVPTTSIHSGRDGRMAVGWTDLQDDWAILLQMLPTEEVSHLLVESYFKRVDWHMHVLHTPMFMEEHRKFWQSHMAGTRDYSAAWLATYFIVISLGLYFLPTQASPYSPEEHHHLPIRWREISERALSMADWSGMPQARSIQTILLMSFYWLNSGGIDRLVVWIGAAVRIAQALGLHTLDRNLVLFPNDQYNIEPENLPFFNKELGSRLFWYLCIFDWDNSYRCRNIQVMSAQDFSTPAPLNLGDEDIVRGITPAKNSLNPTVANYEIHLADLIFLQQSWASSRKTSSGLAILPLETIISIDKLIREKATKFSTFFRIDKSADPAVMQVDQAMPYIPLQRLNLNMEIHCRLLRLHRRCLFDDSDSVESVLSRKASRQSSSQILAIAQEFRRCCDFATVLWWVDAYSILASVGLIASNIHLLSLPSSSTPAVKNDIFSRRQEVIDSLAAIRLEPTVSAFTFEGLRVVDALLSEEASFHNGNEFDALRYRKIVDDAAKASLACAVDETNQMRKLADDLTQRANQGPPPIQIDPLLSRRILDPLIGVGSTGGSSSQPGAYLGSDVFRSTNSSALSLSVPEYDDDFYRSLGFLPPVGQGNTVRGMPDLYAGTYSEEVSMQDW